MAYPTFLREPLHQTVGGTTREFDRHDPTRLRDHLRQCEFACGLKHRLLCMCESLDAFLAPRFVTTLTVATLVVVVATALPS